MYNRNAFVFNLCFVSSLAGGLRTFTNEELARAAKVFERDAELSGFEPVVRKTARTLRTMEVRSYFPVAPLLRLTNGP